MGLFDLFLKKNSSDSNEKLNFSNRMRLKEAEVDIMFIVKNRDVIYVNDYADDLFNEDKDGELVLDGRVVNFIFKTGSEIIEVFVAFDDQDSYMMFTMGAGRDERLHYVAKSIFEFMAQNNINSVFSPTAQYSSQYQYTFKLYKKNTRYFMVNNGQSQAYLISCDAIKNGSGFNDVDRIKTDFWNS